MDELIMGTLLRTLRVEAGRSQREQADLLSDLAGRPVTRNEVSRWENEARLLTPYWQQHYAESFGVTVVELRRAVAASRAQRRRTQQTETQEEGDRVHRRKFIGATAGLTVSLPQMFEGTHGRRVGHVQVNQLLARTARLRRLDDFLGGADTYRLYASELADTTSFVKEASCTAETRKALTAVIAEQAQLAGWAAFDAGMQKAAKDHYLLPWSPNGQ